MEPFLIYLLKSSGCLAVFYLAFLVIFKENRNFKLQRFYLLASIVLSITLALNSYSIRIEPMPSEPVVIENSTSNLNSGNSQALISLEENQKAETPFIPGINYSLILYSLYFSIACLLIIRLFICILRIPSLIIRSEKRMINNTLVYLSKKVNAPTNIFGYIFLNPNIRSEKDLSKIIIHENIHASQYHSIDIFLVELLAAAMWFNPVVWLLRRSLQQIHEYLADEGVLQSGINKLDYQMLLVNQIAEENLLLSSGFQSSIKKRIIMMTTTNVKKQAKLKILALLPITAALLIGVSFMNAPKIQYSATLARDTIYVAPKPEPAKIAQSPTKVATVPEKVTDKPAPVKGNVEKVKAVEAKPVIVAVDNVGGVKPQEPPVAAVALAKMNVLYLGVENPVKIVVSNHSPSEVKAVISNGTITLEDGGYYNYVARPRILGNAILSIYVGDKLIGKEDYRVKRVPDPVAKVAGKKGGEIDKNFLASQEIVQVDMENFDFDLRFTVTSFTVSTTSEGKVYDEDSNSNKLTTAQIDLIKKAVIGQKIYFQNIKCAGPDGSIRELSPIVFEIK